MQVSSDRFAEAILNNPKLSVSVVIEDPAGTLTPLPILDGAVSLDGTATTRASLSLQVNPDPDLIPILTSDPLAPYSNKIYVYRGNEYMDGTVEEIPLGVFHIDANTADDSGSDLGITVSGSDFSKRLADAVMEDSGSIPADTECVDAIQDLVLQVLPDAEFDFVAPTTATGDPVTLPLLNYERGQDRWDLCQGIAEACQCDLYFSSLGVLTLRLHPELDTPDLEISEGQAMISASKTWTRDDCFNRVVVVGDNTGGDPVEGIAIDDDPSSPTRYGPDFGQLTFEWSSDYIVDQDQADATAAYILSLKRGTGQQIALTSLVDPRLRPFDVISVKRDRLGIDSLYIVDALTIPLKDGEMSVETRTTRIYA